MEKEILQLLKDILSYHVYDLRPNNIERINQMIKELEQEPIAHVLRYRMTSDDGLDIYKLKNYLKIDEYEYEVLKGLKIE